MFNFVEFNEQESYDDKIAYAKNHLEFIGSGSSRHVFALDDERVIKIASNENGIIQNNVEKFYSDSNWERLSKNLEYDDDFMWLISERAVPMSREGFEELFKISIDDLYLHLYHRRFDIFIDEIDEKAPIADYMMGIIESKKKTTDNPLVKEIIQMSDKLGFNTSDLARIENWGIREKDGNPFPIITDYGNFDMKFRKFPLRNQDSTSPQLSSL